MYNTKNVKQSKIRVAIRKRPLSTKERNRNEWDIIDVVDSTIVVSETKLAKHRFFLLP
jgi:hypothetical protein